MIRFWLLVINPGENLQKARFLEETGGILYPLDGRGMEQKVLCSDSIISDVYSSLRANKIGARSKAILWAPHKKAFWALAFSAEKG